MREPSLMFKNLRLMVTSFGLGILLTGTVALWSIAPVSYSIMFLVAVVFALYCCLRLVLTTARRE